MSEMSNWVNMCVTKNWREMGAWGMKISDGSWIIVDITDTHLFKDFGVKSNPEDARPRFAARVRRIVLESIPKQKVSKAVKTCGFVWNKEGIFRVNPLEEYIPGVTFNGNQVSPEYEETVIVDSCVQYGLGDVLWEGEDDDADRLREIAKKEAHSYINNPKSLPKPNDVAEFNELLKKHKKPMMFPLANILSSSKKQSGKQNPLN